VAAAVAAAPKRKVSFGAEMSPAKVVVGWHGSSADCCTRHLNQILTRPPLRGRL